ncbi:MAG: dethiobiotin synthase [Gemmatimonadales bacterium]
MTVLLVAGTDTGVGKTWVSRALARALTRVGRRVIAIKPVESGCGDAPRDREDGALLAAATGQSSPKEALIRLTAPVAPAMAADEEGVIMDLDMMVLAIQSEAAGAAAEIAIVEGAGGLLSPISWEWNIVDLGHALEAQVILVAADRLGAINATLLALSALELAGMKVGAVVLTAPAIADASTGTNAAAIRRLSGVDRVVVMPREDDPYQADTETLQGLVTG